MNIDKESRIIPLRKYSELQENKDTQLNKENNVWTKWEAQHRNRNHLKKQTEILESKNLKTELKKSIDSRANSTKPKNLWTRRQVICNHIVREAKEKKKTEWKRVKEAYMNYGTQLKEPIYTSLES